MPMNGVKLVIALIWLTTPLCGQTEPSATIVTKGRSQGSLPPTSARVAFLVTSRAPSASAAAADNGSRQASLLRALTALGYGAGKTRLADYLVRADENYETGKVRHYEARAEIETVVSDLAALGSTLDSALRAGATEVGRITFLADSLEELRSRLLATALAAARRDAEALATASGRRLGDLVEVSTIPFPQGPDTELALMPGLVGSGYLSVGPRDVQVDVTVYAKWRTSP